MKILISACLMGVHCRYNGETVPLPAEVLEKLLERHTLIPVCPETLGGLPTPRQPAERFGEEVLGRSGSILTAAFTAGAEETLHLAGLLGCEAAIMKQRSPSCGAGHIYDGTFTGRVIPGDGVTTQLLRENGLAIYSELEVDELLR